MTRFRMPPSWIEHMKDKTRDLTKRPPRRPWLALGKDMTGQPQSVKRSYAYWGQIHLATPPWMTEEMWAEMKEIYESADSKLEEVDHVVPLKNKYVCGLNVPWNLEVLTIQENQKKSNHHWPNCPGHLCPIQNANYELFGEM